MADLKDTATGKAKDIAGAILGDGNLAEEGKQQKDERHEERSLVRLKGFARLHETKMPVTVFPFPYVGLRTQ